MTSTTIFRFSGAKVARYVRFGTEPARSKMMPIRVLWSRFTLNTAGGVLLGLLTLPSVFAGSNLDSSSYPEPSCAQKPSQPARPEIFKAETEVVSYNDQVDRYNTSMEAYYGCIQRYVDNAARDIEAIKAKTKAAVEQANN